MQPRDLRTALVAIALISAPPAEAAKVALRSTSLASVSYTRRTGMLEIEFRSGAIYRYRGVPTDVYDGLLAAPSKGRFFQSRIRGKFIFERARASASP